MKKICVLTATRAEYGLLKPIILELKKDAECDVRVVVTGAHLSPEFGLTYKEIQEDNIFIDEKIEILLSADTPSAISKSMGLAMISFADYFKNLEPDMLIVLGDRYESLAVCCVAMNQRIPITHLYGGETTQGAIDESIRHAITKMSYLHFTSTEIYRNRIIQLGEEPGRVFNVGSIGVENIRKNKLMSKAELEESIKWSLAKPYAVVTYHPVTLGDKCSEDQIKQLLLALDLNPEYQYIITKGNSDADGRIINQMIDEYALDHENCKVVSSLGVNRYLSAIKHSVMVIGNSSSGIIEVPSFKIPTINIGERQKGRIQADSVINCETNFEEIDLAIKTATSKDFLTGLTRVKNPYAKAGTVIEIVKKIKKALKADKSVLKKVFYDL